MSWGFFCVSLFLNFCFIRKILKLKDQYILALTQLDAVKQRLNAVLRVQNQPMSEIKDALRPYFRDGEEQ